MDTFHHEPSLKYWRQGSQRAAWLEKQGFVLAFFPLPPPPKKIKKIIKNWVKMVSQGKTKLVYEATIMSYLLSPHKVWAPNCTQLHAAPCHWGQRGLHCISQRSSPQGFPRDESKCLVPVTRDETSFILVDRLPGPTALLFLKLKIRTKPALYVWMSFPTVT